MNSLLSGQQMKRSGALLLSTAWANAGWRRQSVSIGDRSAVAGIVDAAIEAKFSNRAAAAAKALDVKPSFLSRIHTRKLGRISADHAEKLAALVLSQDRDRFLSALFLPQTTRVRRQLRWLDGERRRFSAIARGTEHDPSKWLKELGALTTQATKLLGEDPYVRLARAAQDGVWLAEFAVRRVIVGWWRAVEPLMPGRDGDCLEISWRHMPDRTLTHYLRAGLVRETAALRGALGSVAWSPGVVGSRAGPTSWLIPGGTGLFGAETARELYQRETARRKLPRKSVSVVG